MGIHAIQPIGIPIRLNINIEQHNDQVIVVLQISMAFIQNISITFIY